MQSNNNTLSSTNFTKIYASELLPQNQRNWEDTKRFLEEVVKILLEYIKDENERESKVLDFHHPAEMQELIDLNIPDNPCTLQELLQDCRKVLSLGVRTGHPRFFNQISCGLDLISMAGEWLTATANTNMFTYEIAPVFILMEKEVTKKMAELIGWHESDAIFAPGGAMSNLYAMNAARHARFPRCKPLGQSDLPILCTFTSEDSHYSIKGAAAVMGIGTDNCFSIPTDPSGRMIPEALEQQIIQCKKKGMEPFFVCATAGTTVYGAWDPIPQIADICNRHNLWLHVDAAWGGGLLLSPEHRHKLCGIERANSVTWNPHKLMGALLQCSACFIKQEDKPYDVSFDTGDKAMQCGRHNDIFKLWLMWRSKMKMKRSAIARYSKRETVNLGLRQSFMSILHNFGYRRQINRLMDLTAYFTARIRETEGYELVVDPPEFLNVCFWYIPPSLRNVEKAERNARLEKIAPKIKAKMMERGTTMVGYQPDKQRPNFFRMIISNQAITKDDLDFLISEIVAIGSNL